MDICLREATADEADFVLHVRREAFGPYVELAGGWNHAGESQRHAERWGRQRHRVIVADGAEAGYVSTAVYDKATADHSPSFYLHQLMIRPPFQSRGIGSSCLGRLQAEARDLGLPLRLRVLRVNPRALAFYLARGFWLMGESGSHLSLQWNVDDTG